MREALQQKINDSVIQVAALTAELDILIETYVRTVLGCPSGEIVVEMPANGRRFLVEKMVRTPQTGHIYISGQMVKKDGALGMPILGTFVDSPWYECCLSNRLPR